MVLIFKGMNIKNSRHRKKMNPKKHFGGVHRERHERGLNRTITKAEADKEALEAKIARKDWKRKIRNNIRSAVVTLKQKIG